MKQDKQENNDVVKSVEQDTLGPPDDYFVITPEIRAQIEKHKGKSFLIGGNGCAQIKDCL